MAVSESVDQLDNEDQLRSLVKDIVDEETADLRRENAKLRKENEHLRERVDGLEDEIDDVKDHSARERAQLSARINQVEEDGATTDDVADLRDALQSEQKTRSQHDSNIERRVNALADKAGVELTSADLVEDDKLAQLVAVGPEAIADRVYDVHHRARALLEHADEWGKKHDDKNGVRVTFTAPDVKPYLDARFSREFTTTEIKRVFEKVRDLAADSPRRVSKRKTEGGAHMLSVGILHEHDPLYWGDD